MQTFSYPTVLTIAGFDGSGGAGIQGDIKTISALGCYATSVLTALPVQNTMGVKSVYPIAEQVVAEQLKVILEDILPDAIKLGMVHSRGVVSAIGNILTNYPAVPIVFDPVMVSSSGRKLLEDDTIAFLVEKLFPLVTVLTPNLDEAAVLAGMSIKTVDDMYLAGAKIKRTCNSLLLKGGHLESEVLTSLYFDQAGDVHTFVSPRLLSSNTHGTGCTLSSAIASFLARGESLLQALGKAQDYVHECIVNGMDVKLGKGIGPLNHFFDPEPMIKFPQ